MHFAAALLSYLPILAAAAPASFEVRTSSPILTLIAARSASPIHFQPFNANGRAFWLGKHTASYCPQPPVTHCPAGTSTNLIVGDGAASLGKPSVCLHDFTQRPLLVHFILLLRSLFMTTFGSDVNLHTQLSKFLVANEFTFVVTGPSATRLPTPALFLQDQSPLVSLTRPAAILASSPSLGMELQVSLLAQARTTQHHTRFLPISRV